MAGITSADQVKTTAVIGAGQMGAGIAQVLAANGIQALLYDSMDQAVEKALGSMTKRLNKQIEKGKTTEVVRDQILGNIKPANSLSELSDAELVIEAIIENEEIKAELFRELDEVCKPECLFASNTSSISITKLAASTSRPEQFVGMHFMNPVPVMKLVELIRGIQTSDQAYQVIKELTEKLDKTPVTANHDYPGFIVNRILVPMVNEAFYVLMEGIATPEEIDTAMKLGTNQPMGPLTLADFVGLDTLLFIARIFHEQLGEDKYRPCPLLVKYVEAGWVGRKAGRGVYRYDQ